MKRFLVGLILGAVLAGSTAWAAVRETHVAGYGDIIRIKLKRELVCIVGERDNPGIGCGRLDGRGYLVYTDVDGSAAIRRGKRPTMTCLWPEAYCRGQK